MEKKNTKSLIITIIILAVLVVALGGYITYDKLLNKEESIATKKDSSDTKKSSNNVNNIENEVENTKTNENNANIKTEENNQVNTKNETNNYSPNKAKCYGTYYTNGDPEQGIYTLKENGTYRVEGQEISGVFTIHENTITFLKMKHTVGPRDEDPFYYAPESYLIYDDCSKIKLSEPGSHTSASLDKVN